MAEANTPVCECEHISHKFFCDKKQELVEQHTIYGRYHICRDCRLDHPIPAQMLEPDMPPARKTILLHGVMKEVKLDSDGRAVVDSQEGHDA